MCGIGGYISEKEWNGSKMLDVLQHRGPDFTDAFEKIQGNTRVFLGHTRLKIIDLSDQGNQPMYSPDGNVVITYNGEVYNYLALKDQFLKDTAFRSSTDTEVILALYGKMGIKCLDHLNGDFAISIFDQAKQKLYLVRDRAGVKPLYYYHQNGTLIYGSEIRSLISAGLKPKLDPSNIPLYFVFKYTPGSQTLWEDIYRVPPAHYLEYDLDSRRLEIKPYWSPRPDESIRRLSYPDAKAAIFDLLEDACKIRLVGDVPISTFLSGGLDSSIIAFFLKDYPEIAHYCAKKKESDLKKEGTTSDYHYARKLADTWGLNFSDIPIGSETLTLDKLRTILKYSDDLIADGSQLPSYLITRAAAEHGKVVLTGMGADELFLGYAGHQITLITHYIHRLPRMVARPLTGYLASLQPGKGVFKAYKRYLFKIGRYTRYPDYKYGLYNIVGDFDNSLSVFPGHREAVVNYLTTYFPQGIDPYEGLKKFEYDNFLVKNLHYVDRMSMANSLESRVPFLDHRVIEFAFNLPRKYKLSHTGKPKKILKDTFRPHLPAYILDRRKAGFGMPLRSIFSDQQKVDQLLDMEFFANFGGFSNDNIRRVIQNHLQGKEDNSSIIFALLSFQEWYKMYLS